MSKDIEFIKTIYQQQKSIQVPETISLILFFLIAGSESFPDSFPHPGECAADQIHFLMLSRSHGSFTPRSAASLTTAKLATTSFP